MVQPSPFSDDRAPVPGEGIKESPDAPRVGRALDSVSKPGIAEKKSLDRKFEALRVEAVKALSRNILRTSAGPALAGGKGRRRSFWTRDFAFSVKGLLEAGRPDVVIGHLDLLLGHLRWPDRLVPRTMDTVAPRDRSVRILAKEKIPLLELRLAEPNVAPKPEYRDENGSEAVDSNVLALLAALDYLDETGDETWWSEREVQWVGLYRWYDSKIEEGLLRQDPFSDWQDSVRRAGKSFYANLLYWWVSERLKGRPAFRIEPEDVDALRARILLNFFDRNTGIFRSCLGETVFSLEGNLLALESGFIPAISSEGIHFWEKLKAGPLWVGRGGFPGFASIPSPKAEDLHPSTKWIGFQEYHGNLYWSWLIAMAARVARRMGDDSEADRLLEILQSWVERDGGIMEVYRADAPHRPFRTWMARSESDFSWGAAQILESLAAKAVVT